MDEIQTLDTLAGILSELSDRPYDLALHGEHIALAQDHQLGDQLEVAHSMLVGVYAVDEDTWTSMIVHRKSQEDSTTMAGVQRVLETYQRAEDDYLSTSLLESHAQFIIDVYTSHAGEDHASEHTLFSAQWALSQLQDVLSKSALDIVHGSKVWTVVQEWFLEVLESCPANIKATLVPEIKAILLSRLRQPHSNSDETLQAYSTFTTNHQPPAEYEQLLVAASQARTGALKSYQRRERNEASLVQAGNSLESYHRYLGYERRARHLDAFILKGVNERAIAEAARRRAKDEQGAQEALVTFWVDYLDDLRRAGEEDATLESVFRRALRSVPSSGAVWARYIHFLERQEGNETSDAMETESVADAYSRALATQLVANDPEELVPLVLARVGYERRQIEKNEDVEEIFLVLVQTLEEAITQVRASPVGDPRFRLEKILAGIYADLADSADNSIAVWESTTKHYKSSYLAWQVYTEVLIKHNRYDAARTVFKEVASKHLDWPEAVWDAWLSFEHAHGSLEEVEDCMDTVKQAQAHVNFERAKAQKAAYQASLSVVSPSEAVASAPVNSVDANESQVSQVISEAVTASGDVTNGAPARTKRKAEDEPVENTKKAKMEPPSAPLKRDRENCTVFVANLPADCEEQELKGLFKDCGEIRDLKLIPLGDSLVATVEFVERDSVPGALTKDKKRIRDEEVAVHLAWQSTLYITNFPEGTDDPTIRNLFGTYGAIFDVRWPSKKFKNTRRFCYLQYTSPDAAKAALALNGRELEAGLPLNVYLSNPERKKERTDAGAENKEIYVAGLSKFTRRADLEKLFKTYGTVKEIRMELDSEGKSRGFAFVEFDEESSTSAALNANNHELRGRHIAVTIADARRSRKRPGQSDSGLGHKADTRTRSIRLGNIPSNAQEGLLQQMLEKHHKVKRLEIFFDKREALVEFETVAGAGHLLLNPEPLVFDGETLTAREEGSEASNGVSRPAAATAVSTSTTMFAPRTAGRPKAGLGKPRAARTTGLPAASAAEGGPSQGQEGKGQDDFRKLLG